ncbi:HAD-superfamily hydrolase, subfamily IA, variant 1 [candidate division TM7 genomosp. GTL1]|nr:HAD-superfamily hydrolase, subfamily IA, variant 1 [candidate division TM7 genomosp. GTL1]
MTLVCCTLYVMTPPITIPSHIQTIVWDLDGTLLDSFGIYRDCLNEVLQKLGKPEVPEVVLRHNHHGFIEDSIANALKEAGQKLTKNELARVIHDFYILNNAFIKDVDHQLFEDAIDLAYQAHQSGKQQIVVTNRPHGTERGKGSPRNLVANSRLHGFIDYILCGDDSSYRKPHRQFLEARFGSDLADLGEVIVIGDQFVDAELARNLGCNAILVIRAKKIVHLDRIGQWQGFVQIVPSLRSVQIAGG